MFHQTTMATRRERRIMEYIELNIAESERMKRLFKVVGLSDAHFRRQFKASFGETPSAYIMRRRAEIACELMKTTNFHCYRIAAECGFYDGVHFAKLFRKVMGVNPTIWRREHATQV
jgi:AraC family transcriptional regulator